MFCVVYTNKMKNLLVMLIFFVFVIVVMFLIYKNSSTTNSPVNSVSISDSYTDVIEKDYVEISDRKVMFAESIILPLKGSAPLTNVKYSIPIEEIRRGCFRQDCIPSVDTPIFISANEADDILTEDSIGIGLIYNNKQRFYPFGMLVTREIVNDTIAGEPVLITYCPLCGTGIVFERNVDGKVYEFGVSGMLWQSNLLMYNRADGLDDRNLWSQVLGEAVVGNYTGVKLKIIPSNVVKYEDWRKEYSDTLVLNTGKIGDPYNGNYYSVAQSFGPNFNEADSPLDPSAYVHGIEINGVFKAYPDSLLTDTVINDIVGGSTITIERTNVGEVSVTDINGNNIPIVTGFWFSWIAVHPETELWQDN